MSATRRHRSPLGTTHDRLATVLAVLVPLAAVPIASNRASLWLGWTAVLAALALATLLRSWQLEPDWKPRVRMQRLPVLLFLVVPFWAGLQTVPLGSLSGAPVAGALSVLPDAAPAGILRVMGYLLLGALLLEVASRRERVLRTGYILFAGIVAQAIFALVALKLLDDFSPWGPKTAYAGYATGTFVNRNSLATFLGMGLILGLGLLAERARNDLIRPTRKAGGTLRLGYGGVFVLAGMAFLAAALIATQSRLGLLSTVTAFVATVLLLRYRSGTGLPRLAAQGTIALLVLLALVAVLGAGGVTDRLLFTASDGGSRLALYVQTLQMIAERPLTGYGMDSFGPAFEAFRAPPLNEPVSFDLAHNSYLTLWAEFGLIAGSAPIVALAIIGLRLLRRTGSGDGFPGMAAAGFGALLLGALHATGDFSLEIPANAYLLVALLALGLGRRSAPAEVETAPRAATRRLRGGPA